MLLICVIGCPTQHLREKLSTNLAFKPISSQLLVQKDIVEAPSSSIQFIGNFYARYINGNIRNISKGLLVYHLNIRSLQNKVNEIKKIVAENKPHMIGCSECELTKSCQESQLSSLKIPGYTLLLPKSWEIYGYARVVVYLKNSLTYERLSDMEDDQLQTIWIKSGFKNAKPGFYCHGYREYKSNLGAAIQHQTEKLSTFLNQWEQAINYGNPAEPNDIFILCDMNLNSYQDRWMDQTYHLFHLAKLVIRFCNSNNVVQLVKGVTRTQYNKVKRRTNVSCLDHIYTNVKYKCSFPTIITFGNSDHDIVGFTRLSKGPPSVSRTIRKRSYKLFDKEQFLSDVSEIDWTDILTCQDIEVATMLFTNKFRAVLDYHVPWVVYQQRKFHRPWLTN